MPKKKSPSLIVPENNTVKLDDALRERVKKAMAVKGTKVWAEFARIALVDLCRKVEAELKGTNPAEYESIYGDQKKGH